MAATSSRWALRVETLRTPWRLRYALRRRAMLAAYGLLARPRPERASGPLERLGSDYGGWAIPVPSPGSVAYCVGAGVDVSFDLALTEREVGVLCVDPTDESADHVAGRLPFVQAALWTTDGEVEMFVAADPTHRSLSTDDLQATGRTTRVPCRSLAGLMAEHGHETIDLLKLDVEGAEHALVPSVLAARPRVLCVEWHATRPLREMVGAYRALLASYALVARDGADHTFVLARSANVDGAG